MRSRLLALILALLATPAAAAVFEAYGVLPTIEDASLTPDGHRLALIVTDGKTPHVVVRPLDGGPDERVAVPEANIRGLTWADDQHLLIRISRPSTIEGLVMTRRREYSQLLEYDLGVHAVYPLLQDVKAGTNFVLGGPLIRIMDGKPTIVVWGVHFDINGRGHASTFAIDPATRASRLLYEGSSYDEDAAVDGRGRVFARLEAVTRAGGWRLDVRDGETWRPVVSGNSKDSTVEPRGSGRDGTSLLVVEKTQDEVRLHEVSPAAAAWTAPFWTGEAEPDLLWARNALRLAGLAQWSGEERQVTWFDPADQRRWTELQAAFPGQILRIVSRSADGARVVVHADSPTEGPAYALVDLATKKATWLSADYPALKPTDIAPVRAIGFKASDGLPLSGYLTLPPQRAAHNLPLLVLVHDGPRERDAPGFNWLAQAFAAQGYAVLQVNFRGSSGFGPAFVKAGDGQWGAKMQTDLSDGVRFLVSQGTADPKRVCIAGIGYGGYAALLASIYQADVYRCAASVNGSTTLHPLADVQRPALRRVLGVSDRFDPKVAALSPVDQADKVKVPVLLVAGADDTVNLPDQSRQMAAALDKAGKPHEYLVLPHEDHELSHGPTRGQALQALVAFVEKNNPPN